MEDVWTGCGVGGEGERGESGEGKVKGKEKGDGRRYLNIHEYDIE